MGCRELEQTLQANSPVAAHAKQWPKPRPLGANASCAPLSGGACWRALMPKRCWRTASVAYGWTPACAQQRISCTPRWSFFGRRQHPCHIWPYGLELTIRCAAAMPCGKNCQSAVSNSRIAGDFFENPVSHRAKPLLWTAGLVLSSQAGTAKKNHRRPTAVACPSNR